MTDGARDALAGYLFQILGAAGLSARACGGIDDLDRLSCDLVVLARQARILHEVHGEDVVLQGVDGNEGTAVQFKFSRSASTHPIQPAELREILYAFDRSRQAAAPAHNLTGFVLVTNRLLSDQGKQLYNQRSQKTPFAKLTEPERKWLFIPNKKAKEVKAAYGSISHAAEVWHWIFQRLRIFPGIGYDHWLQGLRQFSVNRGLLPEDFETAVNGLIGKMIQGTIAQPLDVSKAWLNQTLIGYSDARSLKLTDTDDSARGAAEQAVTHWFSENLVTANRSLIRRTLLDAVGNQVSQHPIVLLLGAGGCGKSVLAGSYLAEAAPQRFVAATAARAFRRRWVGEMFNRWRSAQHYDDLPDFADNDVLRRVRLANEGGERPFLLIDIDGVDEASNSERNELRRLLELARSQEQTNPSALVVILTSRLTERDLDRARRRVISDLTSTEHPSQLEHLFGVVEVHDFTFEELMQAVRQLGNPMRQRLEASLRVVGSSSSPGARLDDESTMEAARPIASRNLLESLRHPVLWGEFLDLPSDAQDSALDGTPAALDRLAERFVERFCRKAWLRHSTPPTDEVRRALARIARRVSADEERARRNIQWDLPASGPGPLRPQEAAHLYREAISYGMIQSDELDWWAWRHRFVGDYLRGQEE